MWSGLPGYRHRESGGGRWSHPFYGCMGESIRKGKSASVKLSLCKHYPCPRICSRVCHCPAGMERVRWLYFVRQGYRAESKARSSSGIPDPYAEANKVKLDLGSKYLDEATGEIVPLFSGDVHGSEPHKVKQSCPTTSADITKRGLPSSMFAYKSGLAFLIFALIFGAILAVGFLLNGGSLQPSYEADLADSPNVEYQYERR